MEPPRLKLSLLPDLLAVCRLERGQEIPAWATGGDFYSVSRIREELSIICASSSVPENVRASRGWRAIKIEGPLDLDLVGILVSVAVPLAYAGVGILPVGTFNTHYILIHHCHLAAGVKALSGTG